MEMEEKLKLPKWDSQPDDEGYLCLLCNKPVNVKRAYSVELSFETSLLYVPGECPPEESQGCFTVGPECRKNVTPMSFKEAD